MSRFTQEISRQFYNIRQPRNIGPLRARKLMGIALREAKNIPELQSGYIVISGRNTDRQPLERKIGDPPPRNMRMARKKHAMVQEGRKSIPNQTEFFDIREQQGFPRRLYGDSIITEMPGGAAIFCKLRRRDGTTYLKYIGGIGVSGGHPIDVDEKLCLRAINQMNPKGKPQQYFTDLRERVNSQKN